MRTSRRVEKLDMFALVVDLEHVITVACISDIIMAYHLCRLCSGCARACSDAVYPRVNKRCARTGDPPLTELSSTCRLPVTAYNVTGTIGGRGSRDSRQSVYVERREDRNKEVFMNGRADVVRVGEKKTRREGDSG